MQLSGKTALITGGAHRVGKAITMALAEAGANVVINYNRSSTAADKTASEAEALGVGALPIQADVSNHGDVTRMVNAAKDKFGGVDALINSASLFKETPFPTDDIADWHTVTSILLNGSFYCANAIAPLMLERGEGAIVNIVDLSAWIPAPNMIAHSVGKAGLLAMTRQLAVELAPHVRVNAVAPGPVIPPPDYTEEQNQQVANGTLLKRWGNAQDVANTVIFLIQSDYITAEFITVDGGERYGSGSGSVAT